MLLKMRWQNDIKEKILDHFGDTRQHAGKIQGKLFRNDNGKFNYVIEGDLRDLVNDVWDNTEDVFEFHPRLHKHHTRRRFNGDGWKNNGFI